MTVIKVLDDGTKVCGNGAAWWLEPPLPMDYERDPNSAHNSVYAEAASLRRIARVLLQQVKRGGPSNFEQVAGQYLEGDDLRIFRDLVASE